MNEEASSRMPESDDALILVDEWREEVRKMGEAGPLAPAMSFDRKNVFSTRFHSVNAGETAPAVAGVTPFPDETSRT